MKYKSGDFLDSFELLNKCGSGSYGTVFLARNIISEKRIAIKILPQNSTLSVKEINGIIQYQQICPHSDLMQIYHLGKNDDCIYYVMDAADNLNCDEKDYLPDTLQNRINISGRIPPEKLRESAAQLLENLHLIHSRGLLHRDIKPGNILYINKVAKLGDVGLATAHAGNSLVGSAGFLSPEVAAGVRSFSRQDDFYALGKTLYCALTGNPPEKYPSFPADLPLKECKDIISLYNDLSDGHMPEKKKKSILHRKYAIMLCAVIIISAVIAAGIFFTSRKKTPVIKNIEDHSTEKSVPEKMIQQQTEKITGDIFWEIIEKEYINRQLPPGLDDIMPAISKEYQRLSKLKTERGIQAYNRQPTQEELATAQKDKSLYDDPVLHCRRSNQEKALKAFDAEYQHDPVLQYNNLREWFSQKINSTRLLVSIPELKNHDFSAELKEFRQRLSMLKKNEHELLEKFQ